MNKIRFCVLRVDKGLIDSKELGKQMGKRVKCAEIIPGRTVAKWISIPEVDKLAARIHQFRNDFYSEHSPTEVRLVAFNSEANIMWLNLLVSDNILSTFEYGQDEVLKFLKLCDVYTNLKNIELIYDRLHQETARFLNTPIVKQSTRKILKRLQGNELESLKVYESCLGGMLQRLCELLRSKWATSI